MRKTSLLITITLLFFVSLAHAQSNSKYSLDEGDINNQFEFILDESENYKSYKVVPRTWLNKLKTHVNDSIAALEAELASTRQQLNSKQSEIDGIQNQLNGANENVNNLKNQKNSMNLFGMQLDKGAYNAVMWSIIGLLGLALLFYIFRFFRSNAITKDVQSNFDGLSNEFEAYKKRALEKEQKIMRRLQDEINKH